MLYDLHVNIPKAESIDPPAGLNRIYMDSLKANLQNILPPHAVDWLLMVFQAIQLFDDVADGDEVKRDDLNSVIWNTLVCMGQNPFYRENSSVLTPLMGAMILKWQASDTVERYGIADAKSFNWRAGYYDLVLMAVQLTQGTEFATKNAHIVLGLYGETLEDYLKEFEHA